jgi:Hydantoinase/oxoprolinase N-terminal region
VFVCWRRLQCAVAKRDLVLTPGRLCDVPDRVDVGGTFMDIVFADPQSGRTLIHKTPTTKDDPSRGVLAGIGELCARFDLPREAIDHVLHGTTIGTNAVLERIMLRSLMASDVDDVTITGSRNHAGHGTVMPSGTNTSPLGGARRSRTVSR